MKPKTLYWLTTSTTASGVKPPTKAQFERTIAKPKAFYGRNVWAEDTLIPIPAKGYVNPMSNK